MSESARDQCRKEGCSGCSDCGGRYSRSYEPASVLRDITQFTDEEVKKELLRRRGERKRKHRNATKLTKIKALENEIARIRKELE
jgi:hypothetical protein